MPKLACANSGRVVTRWIRSVNVEFDWARAKSPALNTNKNVHNIADTTKAHLFFKFQVPPEINCAQFHESARSRVPDGFLARMKFSRLDVQIISVPRGFGKMLICRR